ncbi:MAG: cysteine desulfurase [Oscillatoriales cyanobacterium]|nr:MAG: cysteine desulfurase [Oscillatoriales cyanobacterium]
MQIYLDHSATTPPCAAAIAAAQRVMAEQWGNPSSIHHWGERAALVLETARLQVASLLNAEPERLLFTSGGTEADNLALLGVAQWFDQPRHLVSSQVEHSAIERSLQALEQRGWAVTRLPVDRAGRVSPADLAAAIRPETVLVSIIFAQSEVGTVQPIAELGAIARRAGVLFHTDAVQAVARVAVDLQTLPVDLLSLSSHKIYGVQGAGALWVRSGVSLWPQLVGGGQEGGLRSGTQALPAIAAFGAAAEQAAGSWVAEAARLRQLRDRLFDRLTGCPVLQPTGDRAHRLPHHASFCLRADHYGRSPLPSGRDLVRQLDRAGIGASSGSACNSGSLSPSPALLAMGYDPAEATAALRFSLGSSTTAEDIDWTAIALGQILDRLGVGGDRPAALAGSSR